MGQQPGTDALLKKIRGCTHCQAVLPLAPKPTLSFSIDSKILIAGQAPGRRAHNSGVPWSDASGARLRQWLGVTDEEFYDTSRFAIVPMGFCYPGTGNSGDLPPRPECAELWSEKVRKHLKNIELKVVIGTYAQAHYLANARESLTETIRSWKEFQPEFFPLPHPSPRNNIWLKKSPWFEKELIPKLHRNVRQLLS